MNTKSVSVKVYRDITARISAALSTVPSSEAEAKRLVDAYLDGDSTVSSPDAMAMLAFSMIRVELDRAMARSARARERARKIKESKPSTATPAPAATAGTPTEEATPEPHLSRRERRTQARLASRAVRHVLKRMKSKERRE